MPSANGDGATCAFNPDVNKATLIINKTNFFIISVFYFLKQIHYNSTTYLFKASKNINFFGRISF